MGKRFEIDEHDCLRDNETNKNLGDICDLMKFPIMAIDLLNEQDEKIKELEDGIKMLKGIKRYDIGELLAENIKLKQSQNQKAIECLETLRKFINENTYYWEEERFADQINDFIDRQIAELRGKESE